MIPQEALLASWPACNTPQPQLSLSVASRVSATYTHSISHQVILTIRKNARCGPSVSDGAVRLSFMSCDPRTRDFIGSINMIGAGIAQSV
jgi:hypothetical protein